MLKAVYTHWNLERNANGFNSFKDFLMTMMLSVLTSRKNFDKVELFTNSFYKKILVDEIGMPFTKVHITLDHFNNLGKIWWGYCKVHTYSLQTEPFFHIDNDAFLWDGLPPELKDCKMFFQSIETPFEEGYGWYKPLLEFSKCVPVFPKLIRNNPVDFAFNCGVMGCNDTSLLKKWFNLSTLYVMSSENQPLWKDPDNLLIHQNLLHEQYFIASLTKSEGWKIGKDIKFLLNHKTLQNDCYKKYRYTHLWGLDKKHEEYMDKVYSRMRRDYPEQYKKIVSTKN